LVIRSFSNGPRASSPRGGATFGGAKPFASTRAMVSSPGSTASAARTPVDAATIGGDGCDQQRREAHQQWVHEHVLQATGQRSNIPRGGTAGPAMASSWN
jgi:hypothetical protein